MKKQTNLKPTMTVAVIQQTGIVCASGDITNVKGNALNGYGGGGDGTNEHGGKPRSRRRDVWDDDEE
jgi:hypothetical protein